VQLNQDVLKLNGTQQLGTYADDINILEGNVNVVNKNTETLVAATKEIGLEVNADNTKYMVMCRDQNAERNLNIITDNVSFERVEEFKYLRTPLTNKNFIQEELEIRLKLGNAYYYSVQNLLSSGFLSKNLKIRIYRSTIMPVVLYGCETWSVILKDELG
jgi:hypothetical protein